jgi:choline dehydrogenase
MAPLSSRARALFTLYTCSLLASCVSAIDFIFDEEYPTGQPLVSSFFGLPGTNATFDYVIVGGGTAGLALATRLADANLSVAVVEAGGFYETDNSNRSVVPGYATYFTGTDPMDFQPLVDWGETLETFILLYLSCLYADWYTVSV